MLWRGFRQRCAPCQQSNAYREGGSDPHASHTSPPKISGGVMHLFHHSLLPQSYLHTINDLRMTVALCIRHPFCIEFYVLYLCAQGGSMSESSPIKWAILWYALLYDTTHLLC